MHSEDDVAEVTRVIAGHLRRVGDPTVEEEHEHNAAIRELEGWLAFGETVEQAYAELHS